MWSNKSISFYVVNDLRPYVTGMKRVAYAARGPTYTQYATAIRCVASDENCSTVRVHYMSDGSARLAFVHRRQEYFLPVGLILRALADVSDVEIQAIVSGSVPGSGGKQFATKRVEIILEEVASQAFGAGCMRCPTWASISAAGLEQIHGRPMLTLENFLSKNIFSFTSRMTMINSISCCS